MSAAQSRLVPERIAAEARRVALADLPPDERLEGPAPDAAFVRSVQNFGLLNPVTLLASDNGTTHWYVAAGRRRIKAARAAGLSEIEAQVYRVGEVSPEVLALVENEQRHQNRLMAYRSIRRLIEQGYGKSEICYAVGVSTTRFDQLMQLDALLPELEEALAQGRLAEGVAMRAARLSEEQQEALLPLLRDGGRIKGADVDQARGVAVAEVAAALPDCLFSGPTALDAQRRPGGDGSLRAAWAAFELALALWQRGQAWDALGDQARDALAVLRAALDKV